MVYIWGEFGYKIGYFSLFLLINLESLRWYGINRMCIMAYLNDQERAALLEGGFAFQYWNGGVSALYTGADAVDFVEQHYSPINFTIANICFGNHPMIADAYDVVLGGEGYVSFGGTSDDIVSVVLDEMVLSFTPFV